MNKLGAVLGAAVAATTLGACGAASSGGTAATALDDPNLTGILFSVFEHGDPQLYATSADGSATKFDTEGLSAYSADWSPGKEQIAFIGDNGGENSDIYTMNADGSNIQCVLSTPVAEGDPTWSHDGRLIYFWQSFDDGTWLVKSVDVATGDVRSVEGTINNDSMIDSSPSGAQLAVSRNEGGDVSIEVVGLTASAESLSIPNGRGTPSWSPSGERLAYTDSDLQLNIRSMVDGETVKVSLPKAARVAVAEWAPSEDALLVVTSQVPAPGVSVPEEVFLVDTRSGQTIPVALGDEGADYFGGISWE